MGKKFTPKKGTRYQNKNGFWYTCTHVYEGLNEARFVSDGGWSCIAHNCTQYEDGTIEWDYSTDGYFTEVA